MLDNLVRVSDDAHGRYRPFHEPAVCVCKRGAHAWKTNSVAIDRSRRLAPGSPQCYSSSGAPLLVPLVRSWGAFAFTMALIIVSIFLLFMVWLAPLIAVLWALSAGMAGSAC